MMFLVILATLLAVLTVYLYKTFKKTTDFWKSHPLKFIPAWPVVGNYGNQAFGRKAFVHVVRDMYNHFPNERYIGTTMYFTPALMIRDLDLIKTISIKDFDHFTDHCGSELESIDPLMCKNLFLLRGQRWKDMRDTLSPAFTSSKMKAMLGFMSECSEQFVEHVKGHGSGVIDVELKDMICRYTNDVIASCAYGSEVDSFRNKDNAFLEMGAEVTDFTGWKYIRFMLLQSWPQLLKVLRMPVFSARETQFFRSLTDQTIAYRQKNSIVRPDMIHLLMQAQKGEITSEKDDDHNDDVGFATKQCSSSSAQEEGANRAASSWKLTNEDISAQVFVFFLGGFDTASTVMSFLAYELAMNEGIQRRLQEEVDEVLSAGSPTYDAIVQMKYMDMVVCESLRKWSPASQLGRLCTKDYTIQPVLPHEEPLVIAKGTLLTLPITGIMYDHKYFPDPYQFDPERFSDENKDNIVPGSYIPFGLGPRFCIGNRFAILEMKVLMFHLLAAFDISFTAKSVVPIVLDTNHMMPKINGGFHVGLKLRNKINTNF